MKTSCAIRKTVIRSVLVAIGAALVVHGSAWAAVTTYTWTGAAGDGKWSTPGNWDNGTGTSAVYPNGKTTAAASFTNGTDVTVTLDVDFSISSLTIGRDGAFVRFVSGADSHSCSAKALSTGGSSTAEKTASLSEITFDGVTFAITDSSTNFAPGNRLTVTGGASVSMVGLNMSSTHERYAGSVVTVEESSSLTFSGTLRADGSALVVVDNATLTVASFSLNGTYYSYNYSFGGGGRLRLQGTQPTLRVTGSFSVSDKWARTALGDVEFLVPEAGYETAPIVYEGANAFPSSTGATACRFSVMGGSPMRTSTTYGTTKLVSSSAGFNADYITFSDAADEVADSMQIEGEPAALTFTHRPKTSCLKISGSPRDYGTGDYGYVRGLAENEARVFTAPTSPSANLTCTGYRLYDVDEKGNRTEVSESPVASTTCSYTHGKTRRELVWQWQLPEVYVATPEDGGADGDDRGDADHPYATIQAAVNKYDYSLVKVKAGTYQTTATTLIDRGVTVCGLGEKPDDVVLELKSSEVRVLQLDHADAVVTNITVTNGGRKLQGGVKMTAGLVTGCLITNCHTKASTYNGGGVLLSGGVVRNCRIVRCCANDAAGYGKSGGGVSMSGSGLVENCRIVKNKQRLDGGTGAQSKGGGVQMSGGTLRGCLVDGNQAVSQGTGLYATGGLVENCTFVNNNYDLASTAVACEFSVVNAQATTRFRNNIVWNNSTPSKPLEANVVVKAFQYVEANCSKGAYLFDVGNFESDPQFDVAYGLSKGSSCVDKGVVAVWMLEAKDLNGNPRVVNGMVDLGCFEQQASTEPECWFDVESDGRQDCANVTLTAHAWQETDVTYYWILRQADGTVLTRTGPAAKAIETFELGAGAWDITLAVTNKSDVGAVKTVQGGAKVYASFAYVNANGSGTVPYATAASGATTLKDAFDILGADGTARLCAGVHLLSAPLALKAAGGTRIVPADNSGEVVIRVANADDFTTKRLAALTLESPTARLEGVTVVGGVPGAYYDGNAYSLSDGIVVKDDGAVVTNCIVRDYGVQLVGTQFSALAVEKGLACDVRLERCTGSMGSSLHTLYGVALRTSGGVCDRLVVANCSTSGTAKQLGSHGGVVRLDGGAVRNSLFVDCRGSHTVPLAIASGTLENCTIVSNKNTSAVSEFVVEGTTYKVNIAGGLSVSGTAQVRNTIFSGNWSVCAAAYSNLWQSAGASAAVTYSLTDDREAFAGVGNKIGDPLLKNRRGRLFTLRSCSPAIDAGLPLDWMTSGATDLYGNPRVLRGVPDMGCSEWQPTGLSVIVR